MSMLDTCNQIYAGLYARKDQAQSYVSLHKEGKYEELEAQLQGDKNALVTFLAWVLFPQHLRDPEKSSCKWLLANSNLLTSADGIIDTGLYYSVYCWHEEGIKTFLSLGANPNKEIMPQRFVLDVYRNRTEYSLHSSAADSALLQDAVESLEGAGAQTYLEYKLRDKHIDPIVFDLMDTREPWVERLLNDLQTLPSSEQIGWIALLEHCSVKSKSRSKTWTKKLSNLMESIDANTLISTIQHCLQLATDKRPSLIFGDLSEIGDYYHCSDSCDAGHDLWGTTKKNSIILKGLIWVLSYCGEGVEHDFYSMAKAMYTKLPGIGIRNVLLANTSFAELLNIGSDKALIYALRLQEEADNQPAIKKMKALLDPYLKERGFSMNLLQLRLETENWQES